MCNPRANPSAVLVFNGAEFAPGLLENSMV